MPFGLQIANLIGRRIVCFGASILFASAVFTSSYIQDFYLFAIVYGIFTGLSTGLLYMIPLANAYEYYPNNKGLVSGIIVSGFGLGSFVMSWVVYGIVNPFNM